jgi:predicted nucleic acid-binding protein
MAGGGSRASAFRGVILLDTNVVSAVMLQRPEPAVVAWLDQVDPRQVWLPSVVVFELRYGAALHPDATRRRALGLNLNRLIDELIQERIASLDAASAQKAAQLAAQRKTQGRTVDLRDTLIAGIALANQAQLATRNLCHFSDTSLSLINPFPATPSE